MRKITTSLVFFVVFGVSGCGGSGGSSENVTDDPAATELSQKSVHALSSAVASTELIVDLSQAISNIVLRFNSENQFTIDCIHVEYIDVDVSYTINAGDIVKLSFAQCPVRNGEISVSIERFEINAETDIALELNATVKEGFTVATEGGVVGLSGSWHTKFSRSDAEDLVVSSLPDTSFFATVDGKTEAVSDFEIKRTSTGRFGYPGGMTNIAASLRYKSAAINADFACSTDAIVFVSNGPTYESGEFSCSGDGIYPVRIVDDPANDMRVEVDRTNTGANFASAGLWYWNSVIGDGLLTPSFYEVAPSDLWPVDGSIRIGVDKVFRINGHTLLATTTFDERFPLSLISIDLDTGKIASLVPYLGGAQFRSVAVSRNGSYLYLRDRGGHSLQKYTISIVDGAVNLALISTLEFDLVIRDFDISPTDADRCAVILGNEQSSSNIDIVILQGDTLLPSTWGSVSSANYHYAEYLNFTDDGSELFVTRANEAKRLTIDESGISAETATYVINGSRLEVFGGRVYDRFAVYDQSIMSRVATFSGYVGSMFPALDQDNNALFQHSRSGLTAYDIDDFTQIKTIPFESGTAEGAVVTDNYVLVSMTGQAGKLLLFKKSRFFN